MTQHIKQVRQPVKKVHVCGVKQKTEKHETSPAQAKSPSKMLTPEAKISHTPSADIKLDHLI